MSKSYPEVGEIWVNHNPKSPMNKEELRVIEVNKYAVRLQCLTSVMRGRIARANHKDFIKHYTYKRKG